MVMLLRKSDSPNRCLVVLVSSEEFSDNGGTVSFYLLQHIAAQGMKCSEPSQEKGRNLWE